MLVQEEPKLIGNVAKSSGVPIKTIRYYEELGLLKSSARTEGGFRLFNSDVLERLGFVA
ncbi:transcriptional regulator (plasmid) [Nostoc linckia NIES-25]|nr:transcriptional regulator [Nostoc linckia NIES-25]